MLFGPVTNAERATWQARAAGLLADYLDVARRTDLPTIRWTVATAGSTLIGHCETGVERDRRQEALDLPNVRPEVVHAGYARRHASGSVTTSKGPTTHVTLIADPDLEREQLDRRQAGDPPRDAA